MKKVLVYGLAAAVLASLGLLVGGDSAQAYPTFKKQFDNMYMQDEAIKAAWDAKKKRSSCNVCHVGGFKEREKRNDLGMALSKLLEKKDHEAMLSTNAEKDPAAAKAAEKKVQEALKKVTAQPSGKGKPTFLELIKSGDLPITK